jgi:dihydroorotate dehydrogenase (NAD+) catalytic subunit
MIYDISKTFEENITYGPFFEGQLPEIPAAARPRSFLGKTVNSIFGVSACPLTHGSRNIFYMSRLGYDIITYRSVRSREWHGLTAPNWRYVDLSSPLGLDNLGQTVVAGDVPFPDQEVSTANSFGIQSTSPALWQRDYEVARSLLLPGQVLILSIMFTPEEGHDILADAQLVAKYAMETSADIIELNLAHPNSGKKSLVYEDGETSVRMCETVKKILGDRHLLAKVGYYRDPQVLKTFLTQTKGMLSGISSTNTIGMKITDKSGGEVFPGRPSAGVSGGAIRSLIQSQAKRIVAYRQDLALRDFTVIGIGGVMEPKHIDEYLELGVDAVQAATGVWVDPGLALRYKSGTPS